METTLKSAYKEVSQILNLLGNEYKSKIPSNVLTLLEEGWKESNKKQDGINVQDKNELAKAIQNGKISRNALAIISILNIKYWTDEEEKQKLKAIYDENEEKYQNKINCYKEENWLKRKTKKENLQEEVSLVEIQEKSIWTKIKIFLKKLMPKRKRD